MDVGTVADNLCGDLVGLQDGAGKPWRAVTKRRHAVEEVGGLARPGGDRRERLLVSGRRMTERHPMSTRREPAHEVEAAIQLGRERHDPDVGRGALDLGENISGGEVRSLGRSLRSLG